jgi:hypothetical protein
MFLASINKRPFLVREYLEEYSIIFGQNLIEAEEGL